MNASEWKGAKKVCNLCKNKSHKMIWGVFGVFFALSCTRRFYTCTHCTVTHLFFFHISVAVVVVHLLNIHLFVLGATLLYGLRSALSLAFEKKKRLSPGS